MANPMRAIKSLLRFARVTAIGKDDKDFPVQQVSYFGKVGDAVMWFPFGMTANVPLDFINVIMSMNSNPEERVAFPTSAKERLTPPLPSPLESGEVVMFNPLTRAYVFFRADGSIEIKSPADFDLTVAGNVNAAVEGNLIANVGGDASIDSEGTITIDGATKVNVLSAAAIELTAPAVTINADTSIETESPRHLMGDGIEDIISLMAEICYNGTQHHTDHSGAKPPTSTTITRWNDLKARIETLL